MLIRARAILCSSRPHGEHGAIVRLLTAEHGLLASYLPGARGRELRPLLVPGNVLDAEINARAFEAVRREWRSFDAYIWSWTDGRVVRGDWTDMRQIPVTTALSDRVAADMKSRGFAFVGSTTIYAHLQAIGVVDDHLVSCFRRTGAG